MPTRLSASDTAPSTSARAPSAPGSTVSEERVSGWAHRAVLKQSQVTQVSGASYDLIDDAGLHVTVDGEQRVIACDHVVVCAGQESVRDLVVDGSGRYVIGGADVAAELDAKRAIKQGTELVASF